MRERTRSSWLQYGVAVFAMILAAALRLLLDPLLGDLFPFATLLFAVLVAAWYDGFGPAVAATVVGAIAAFVFLLPPRNELTVEGIENQAGLVLYLLAGFGISVLGGSMQTARRRTEDNLKQLEHEVRQRREAERELQQSQKQLEQQREELRTTLLSIGDAVITTDPQGKVTFLNPVAEKLTGWTQADADGVPLSHVFQIVNEYTRQTVENPVEKALQSGRIVGLANHTNLLAKDGTECSIEDSAAPIRSENGEIFGCVLVFRDVTERRHLERERQQFVRLAETSSEFIGMCGMNQIPFFVNQAGLELVGLESLEQAKQAPVQEFFFPEDREMIENEFLPEVLKEGQGEVEVRFRHFQTGEPLWMIYNVSVLRDERNEPVGFATVSRNITDRKQAVAALQESEALLRFTLDSTEIGQWDLDLTTDTAKRTLRHDQIFGYDKLSPEWSYETFLNRHVHPDDRDWVDSRFQEATQNGRGWDFECRIIRTDGALRWISVTSSVYMTTNGQPTRMAGLVTDITKRKNAEIRERKLLEDTAAANAKFHAFFDQGPLFAGIMALDGTLLEANRLSLEACGYASEQVLEKPFWEGPWWNPSSQLKQQIKRACEQASTGEAYRAEMPYFVADGSQRMVDFISSRLRMKPGGSCSWLLQGQTSPSGHRQSIRFFNDPNSSVDWPMSPHE